MGGGGGDAIERKRAAQRAYMRRQREAMKGCKTGYVRTSGSRPDETALAERNARYDAMADAPLTAVLMGDPAPGWSALERRR